MSYTIEYQLTLEDYKEAWQPLIQKRGNSLPRLAAFAIFMFAIFLFALSRPGTFLYGIIAGASGLMGILFVFIAFIQGRSIETFWKANPFLTEPISLVASDNSILIQSADSRTELLWRAFTHRNETANLFLLHLSEQTFYVVPKRFHR
jgi:hypothetical protein